MIRVTRCGFQMAAYDEKASGSSVATLVWSVMTSLCGTAGNYLQLLLMRAGVGVAEPGFTGPANSLLGDHYREDQRAFAMPIMMLGVPFGALIGALIGGIIAQSMGWRWAFIIMGVPGVLIALLVALTLREPPRGVVEGNASGSGSMIAQKALRWRAQHGDPTTARAERLSYRDLAAMMAERGVAVTHTTIMRWVLRYVPEYEKRCARFARPVGSSWRMDETSVSVRGGPHYLYRAVDREGKSVDSLLCSERTTEAAQAFFRKAVAIPGVGWPRTINLDGLANGLFSLELATRLAGTRATSNCLTPGSVRTNILRNVARSNANQAKSPAQGAATQCYVATNPALARVSGESFKDCNPAPQSEDQRNAAMAARLWKVSTELTAKYLG